MRCTHGLGVKAARYNDAFPNVDGMTPAQIRSEYPFCKASFCKQFLRQLAAIVPALYAQFRLLCQSRYPYGRGQQLFGKCLFIYLRPNS